MDLISSLLVNLVNQFIADTGRMPTPKEYTKIHNMANKIRNMMIQIAYDGELE